MGLSFIACQPSSFTYSSFTCSSFAPGFPPPCKPAAVTCPQVHAFSCLGFACFPRKHHLGESIHKRVYVWLTCVKQFFPFFLFWWVGQAVNYIFLCNFYWILSVSYLTCYNFSQKPLFFPLTPEMHFPFPTQISALLLQLSWHTCWKLWNEK